MGASCHPCLRINEDTIQYNTILTYKLYFRHFHFQVRRTHAYPHKKALDIYIHSTLSANMYSLHKATNGILGTYSFIHYGDLYSATSRLLLRSAPTIRYLDTNGSHN